jgi:hypothetical protein
MKGPRPAVDRLDADLVRLEREQLVVLHLDDLESLLADPVVATFAPRRGPCAAWASSPW